MQNVIYMGKPKPVGTAAPVRWPKPPTQAEQAALLARLAEASKKVDAMQISLALRAAMKASDERVKELLSRPKPKRRSRRPSAPFPWFD